MLDPAVPQIHNRCTFKPQRNPIYLTSIFSTSHPNTLAERRWFEFLTSPIFQGPTDTGKLVLDHGQHQCCTQYFYVYFSSSNQQLLFSFPTQQDGHKGCRGGMSICCPALSRRALSTSHWRFQTGIISAILPHRLEEGWICQCLQGAPHPLLNPSFKPLSL